MTKKLSPYKKWRKKTAKQLKCSQEAIDTAVEEGHELWKIMVENHNPLVAIYRQSFMPMFAACFTIYLYSRNPLLKSLMEAKHDDQPDTPLHAGGIYH